MSKDDIRQETGQVIGVNQVNFELAAGEFFCIMGLSGSGKSTLLRCVNRLIEPTSGSIELETESGTLDISQLSHSELRNVRMKNISMVFQHFGLFPHRNVRDNVAYGLEIQGVERAKRREAAESILSMVGLEGWGNAYPKELSGGMQQRVGLARAITSQAQVLLMDEPFSALDPLIKVNMQDEMIKIQRELKRTILFITHDLDEALRLGDRIAIMEDGEVVQIGTPEDIIVNPKTKYVADFVKHADPTNVITARTIAQPLDGALFTKVRDDGTTTFYERKGTPDVQFGWNPEGDFNQLVVDGQIVQLKPLKEVLELDIPEIRSREIAVFCDETATLNQLMRARMFSRLPALVMQDGRLLGIIDEREIIHGTLERRAYTPSSEVLENLPGSVV